MELSQALSLAIGALASAVIFLYLRQEAQFTRVLAKLDECEEDREKLWAHIAGASTGKPAETFSLSPKPNAS